MKNTVDVCVTLTAKGKAAKGKSLLLKHIAESLDSQPDLQVYYAPDKHTLRILGRYHVPEKTLGRNEK